MAKCVLHIGGHKTGTSAMQKVFFACADTLLAEKNLLYPKICISSDKSHNELSFSIVNKQQNLLNTHLAKLKDLILSNSEKDLLISSEILEKTPLINLNGLLHFLKFLKQFYTKIDVVYSIRDCRDLCNSVFKQYVGSTQLQFSSSIETFIESFFYKSPTFLQVINSWCILEEINSVTVSKYSSNFTENIQQFEHAIETQLNLTDPGLTNLSIDGVYLQILYYYNMVSKALNCYEPIVASTLRSHNNYKKEHLFYKTSILTDKQCNLFKDFYCVTKTLAHPKTRIIGELNFDTEYENSTLFTKILDNTEFTQMIKRIEEPKLYTFNSINTIIS